MFGGQKEAFVRARPHFSCALLKVRAGQDPYSRFMALFCTELINLALSQVIIGFLTIII